MRSQRIKQANSDMLMMMTDVKDLLMATTNTRHETPTSGNDWSLMNVDFNFNSQSGLIQTIIAAMMHKLLTNIPRTMKNVSTIDPEN